MRRAPDRLWLLLDYIRKGRELKARFHQSIFPSSPRRYLISANRLRRRLKRMPLLGVCRLFPPERALFPLLRFLSHSRVLTINHIKCKHFLMCLNVACVLRWFRGNILSDLRWITLVVMLMKIFWKEFFWKKNYLKIDKFIWKCSTETSLKLRTSLKFPHPNRHQVTKPLIRSHNTTFKRQFNMLLLSLYCENNMKRGKEWRRKNFDYRMLDTATSAPLSLFLRHK